MQEQIERDIKTALLAGDKMKAEVLRNLKSSILNEAISKSLPRDNIDDSVIQAVLSREAKRRQEAADMYGNASETQRQEKELAEKAIIDGYLPEQMDESQVREIVAEEIAKLDGPTIKEMGQIIGAVRSRTKGQADGALIARLVKENLGQS
jgi:uncharacterized protein YqeY